MPPFIGLEHYRTIFRPHDVGWFDHGLVRGQTATSARLAPQHVNCSPVTMDVVGAIDEGTTSTRFILFNRDGEIVCSAQEEITQHYPQPGWCEHDPEEIVDRVWRTIERCMEEAGKAHGITAAHVKGVGVTNQRETTVVWDRETGKPLHRAVVWLDMRTAETCHKLEQRLGGKDALRAKCGLPISTYFSGVKLRWLIDNVPEVSAACATGKAMFGTVDSWLLYNLTGGVGGGGVHVTDVTNASRTMLMDLRTREWDAGLCESLGVPMDLLPRILSCSEAYGALCRGALQGVTLGGCLGDQQAAMLGQRCAKGDGKNTYGTGCFLLMNTGEEVVPSSHGLLSTVCFQLGPKAPCQYALEGSIAVGGAAVQWLRDNLGVISKASEVETLAASVEDTGGMHFVPAFTGLFAPRWRDDARGCMVGMTQYTTRAHVCRAALEAVCYQTREVLDAMVADSRIELARLKVDGGMTVNNLLLSIQADTLGKPVLRPPMVETTALGAALAAGLHAGVWTHEDLFRPSSETGATVFEPFSSPERRAQCMEGWNRAIAKAYNSA